MSELKSKLEADLKQAMLARDGFLVETLRGLKAVILNEEVAKGARDEGLSDETIEQLFARESKKRDEAAGLFEQGGNQASADKERAEKEIIQKYLPEQLSENELQVLVNDVILEIEPEGMKDMGRVIGAVKAKVGNTADGAMIANLVKKSLQ
jgi:uncharacterized protein